MRIFLAPLPLSASDSSRHSQGRKHSKSHRAVMRLTTSELLTSSTNSNSIPALNLSPEPLAHVVFLPSPFIARGFYPQTLPNSLPSLLSFPQTAPCSAFSFSAPVLLILLPFHL